ncbi:outer membrane protein assembly factor BamE [Kamptonema cortianum]|nr:outer membrane protein assembly factor BamE [Kamptonema cortianum]MDL5048051.1 outer membrane protein assembly factor BamE [Oscillatoria amoena NRMC-F 0135]
MLKTIITGLLASLIVIGAFTPSVNAFEDKPKKEKSSKEKKDKFSKIKKGMSMDEVRDILGEPEVEGEIDEGITWFYRANALESGAKEHASAVLGTMVPSFLGSPASDASRKAMNTKRVSYTYLFKNGKVSKISKSTSKN